MSVNGVDLGIYANVESLKKPLLARWFDDDGGNLYEGVASDFRDGWIDTFERKTNESMADRADLAGVVTALSASDSELAAVDAVVDLDAYLSFWAMESLIDHWDGYAGSTNNFYIYRDPTSSKFHFLPWGADGVLGIRNVFPPLDRPPSVHAVAALPRRLYRNPETQAQYRARLQQLLDAHWDETALNGEIDRMVALIGDHVHVSDDKFTEGVARVRAFIDGRRADVQSDLDGAAPAWEPPGAAISPATSATRS